MGADLVGDGPEASEATDVADLGRGARCDALGLRWDCAGGAAPP